MYTRNVLDLLAARVTQVISDNFMTVCDVKCVDHKINQTCCVKQEN